MAKSVKPNPQILVQRELRLLKGRVAELEKRLKSLIAYINR
jgi:hypothetical protein